MSVRFARLERSVYQALAGLIPGSIRDPRAHLAEAVVVTKVALAPDLSSARVLVTVKANSDEEQREVFGAISRAAGYLRKQLGQTVKLRRLPELKLVLDQTPETAARVEDILRELAEERREREGDEGDLEPDADEQEEQEEQAAALDATGHDDGEQRDG